MLDEVSQHLIPKTATIRDAIKQISESSFQVVIVVDHKGKVIGTVTDGDIRRGLLRGLGLGDLVVDLMNRNPFTMNVGTKKSDVLAAMKGRGIRHVPLVDENNIFKSIIAENATSKFSITESPVLLMAGGRGQRLRPLTESVPKPMIKIGDVPILGIILTNLSQMGFKNVYISVNYLAEQIIEYVGNGESWGLKVEYVHETSPLGTAGALGLLPRGILNSVIVMNSDLVTQVNLRELLDFHEESKASLTVGVRNYDHQIPFGVLELKGPNITSLSEKPTMSVPVSAGIYAVSSDILQTVPLNQRIDMTEVLDSCLDRQDTVVGFPIHESWIDVGRIEDLNRARSESND